ncbi:hypothetical protein [Paenibacillus lentus]|uniref:Uncharacterized protein n=1 Tax=Paenibacillus lentus TaxID=1338368 RepID=A0A3Q8SBZ1_9BACL|nr:hypothetical protein [Paenibacillus lentus]AZK47229.1 hypothetical protein EIM92_14560 [Paenibacillus lentus]
MNDEQRAIEAVLNFLNDDTKKFLLVRGYDEDAKLRVVLSCLNKTFERGIIRTSSMSEISFLINRAFKKNHLPTTIKSTSTYDLGRMTVVINSYATSTKNNPTGNDNCFTVFFPVQTVLNNPKRYKIFLEDLAHTNSRKVILITTNEWSIDEWDIEKQVDEVYFYSIEEDNPQVMKNLRNNGVI